MEQGCEVTVNGGKKSVPPGTTVGHILDSWHSRAPVVAAVNGEHVSRAKAKKRVLKPGDKVEIVGVRQGG